MIHHLLSRKPQLFFLFFLMMCTAAEAGQPTFVYLVRHAEKQVDHTKDPPLSKQGEARVKKLETFLRDIAIDKVFATPYRRTKMTVQSIADSRNLDVDILPAQDYQLWKRAIKKQRGKTLFIAGHSNTIPAIIEAFGVDAPRINESEYDYLFLLVVHGRKSRLQVFQFQVP